MSGYAFLHFLDQKDLQKVGFVFWGFLSKLNELPQQVKDYPD